MLPLWETFYNGIVNANKEEESFDSKQFSDKEFNLSNNSDFSF